MATDMEVHMVAEKVADIVANVFANMVTKLGVPNLARRRRVPFFLLLAKLGIPNLVRELVTWVGLLGPNFFYPKLTRIACLLSFASFIL